MIHFADPLGVCECAVAFTHARDALGRRNTEKYGTSSCRYAGECGRFDKNVASYQHRGGAVGSGIAVEISKKNLMVAVEFVKNCPP